MKLTDTQIEGLELQKEEALKAKNIGEALMRLKGNPDYQLLIEDTFLVQYPRDIADAIAKNTGAYDTDVLVGNLKAINTFVGFTMKIGNDYGIAIQDIEQINQLLESNDLDETEEV